MNIFDKITWMWDAVKILPHYTYSDYLNWEGQWELIEGIPYAMNPLPIPKHLRIAGRLTAEFIFKLKYRHSKFSI